MSDYEKICVVETEAEASLLEAILKEREIPHILRSYHDSAYDGLFQGGRGWGHIEASVEFKDAILDLQAGLSGE